MHALQQRHSDSQQRGTYPNWVNLEVGINGTSACTPACTSALELHDHADKADSVRIGASDAEGTGVVAAGAYF